MLNDNLEQQAKLLYDYWFAQFDFPDESGKPYKSSGGPMVWNAILKHKIPEKWIVKRIDDIMYLDHSSINPKRFGEKIFEHYSIPAFDQKLFPAYDKGISIESGKYRVYKDAILVSKLNPQFKRIWNPLCITENAICSTEFLVYRPINQYDKPYCYALLNSSGFYSHMISKAISSTGSRKRIQPDVSSSYFFAMPEEKIIAQFNKLYQPIMFKQSKIHIENHELCTIRDWLLPMLMNGQATIED